MQKEAVKVRTPWNPCDTSQTEGFVTVKNSSEGKPHRGCVPKHVSKDVSSDESVFSVSLVLSMGFGVRYSSQNQTL